MWNSRAEARRAAVNKYLWHADEGLFYDYDFTTQQSSKYDFISTFYPLWSGLASKEQAAAVRKHLPAFEKAGGLATSDVESGVQWDYPFGWAPTNWFATKGLEDYGYTADADRISNKFTGTVRENYQRDGTIREKYDMATRSSTVQLTAGYSSNVIGFGWTNGVYLEMTKLLMQGKAKHAAAN
jgi:alpha,alpha-trehalase